jgi:hypothetical protein
MATRGPNWTAIEHKLLCQAFIATSEDPIVGTDQKGTEFQEKMHVNYKKVVADHNRANGTSYHERKGTSNYSQFKKLSAAVLKYIGVEDNAGDPPSGDNDKAVFLEACRDTFGDRYPHFKNLLDSVLYCKDILQQCPKWEKFEKKNETQKKKRPQGTKKAKQEKSDEKLVKRVLSVTGDEKGKLKHRDNKDVFMAKLSGGIDVMTRNMSDKNDTDLLAFCSPRTQRQLAAELMRERIKRMKTERMTATVSISGPETMLSSLSCDAEDDACVYPEPVKKAAANESDEESEESSYDEFLMKKKKKTAPTNNDDDDDEVGRI